MDFICGDYFKSLCDFSLDEHGFKENSQARQLFKEPLFFVKTDYIFNFSEKFLKNPVRLLTHNSDYRIDNSHSNILNNPNLIHWFAQNIDIHHQKLSSIPIGIANPRWPHGNQKLIKEKINQNNEKTNLIYANFSINTNPTERNKCLSAIKRNGIRFKKNLPFENYLDDLSRSMFSISPNGNGIDCHKTWESLYLKTIPIVTKSINSLQYSDLPILIIDNWDSLDALDLTKDLYNSLMDEFDIKTLNSNRFLI